MSNAPRFVVWVGIKAKSGDFDEEILDKLPPEYHTKPKAPQPEYREVDVADEAVDAEPITIDSLGEFEDDNGSWSDYDELVSEDRLKELSGLPLETISQSGADVGLGVQLYRTDWDAGTFPFEKLATDITTDANGLLGHAVVNWALGMGFAQEDINVWCHTDIDF